MSAPPHLIWGSNREKNSEALFLGLSLTVKFSDLVSKLGQKMHLFIILKTPKITYLQLKTSILVCLPQNFNRL